MLLVIMALGGVARGIAAASPEHSQSADERAYAALTNQFLLHKNLAPPGVEDPVRWGPGAPILFSVAVWASGTERVDGDVPAAYAAQAVVGTLLIPVIFLLGVLIAGTGAGLVAAAATAAYPPLIVASGDLVTEPLGTLLLASSCVVTILAMRRATWRPAALAGVVFGLAVLARVDMLAIPLLALVVVLLATWRRWGGRRASVVTGAMLAGLLVPLLPWTAYASHVQGHLVPVTSGGASNLFIGTYLPGDGRLFGVKKAFADEARRLDPRWRDRSYAVIPQRVILDAVVTRYPGRERNAALYAASMDNLRDFAIGQPLRFAGMMVRKAGRLWLEPSRGSARTRQDWFRLVHVPLLLASAIGLLAGLLARRGRDAPLVLLTVILLYTTVVNAVLVAEARHNVPVMPILFVAGAAGWSIALGRGRRSGTAPARVIVDEGPETSTGAGREAVL